MTFRRFTDPTYTDAPSLPVGPTAVAFDGTTYGRINVTSGGTGGLGSAYADDYKATGPNVGTLFVAFGEDASSANANRGLRALASNTDHLDDLFHRDLAVPVRTDDVVAASPVYSIVLPAGTFVGNDPSYPLSTLFSVIDNNDNDIITNFGAKTSVTSISGASVGDGFSTGAVTLTLFNPVPTGTTYRVYYGSRSNLANLEVDAFTFIKVRGAEEVTADVENVFRKMQGPTGAALAWNATPTTTLWDLAYGSLDNRYRRSTARGAPLSLHPIAVALDTAGSGAWYTRDSIGFTGYNYTTNGGTSTHQGVKELFFGGQWNAYLGDEFTPATSANRKGVSSGFVVQGRKQSSTTLAEGGNLFSFLHVAVRDADSLAPSSATSIPVATTVNLSGSTATLTSGWFKQTISGTSYTAISLGYDFLRVDVSGVIHTLIVTFINTDTEASVRYPDGGLPNFVAASGTVVDWGNTIFMVSEDAANMHDKQTGFGNGVYLNGMMFADPPPQRRDSSAYWPDAVYAKFFGRTQDFEVPVLAWGGHEPSSWHTYQALGFLRSDGSLQATGLRHKYTHNYPQTDLNANTGSRDIESGSIIKVIAGSGNVTLTLTMIHPGETITLYLHKSAGPITDTVSFTTTDYQGNVLSNSFSGSCNVLEGVTPETYLFIGQVFTTFIMWRRTTF